MIETASFYELNDGRFWSIAEACFVDTVPEGSEVILLYADGKPAGEEYLVKTLVFYNFPLGELENIDEQSILDKLNKLDAKYLTPRILAGLALGDTHAETQWEKHEEEAIPLREKLTQLRQ